MEDLNSSAQQQPGRRSQGCKIPYQLQAYLDGNPDPHNKARIQELISKDSKIFEVITKHYTDLFVYQARQRLDAIRFFFVGLAVLFSGLVNLVQSGHYIGGMFLSLFCGFIALIFQRLDCRNAQIVEIDEKPLKSLQKFFATLLGSDGSLRTFDRCDAERKSGVTYGYLIPFMYDLFWVASFAIAVYCVFQIGDVYLYSVYERIPLILIPWLLLTCVGLYFRCGPLPVEDTIKPDQDW